MREKLRKLIKIEPNFLKATSNFNFNNKII